MEIKRRELLSGLAALTILGTAGRASFAAGNGIQLGAVSSAALKAINGAAEKEFEAHFPSIDVRTVPLGDNWEPALQTLLRQAIVGDKPDFVQQAMNYTKILASRKLAQPLDQFIEAVGGWEALGLPSAMKETVSVDGKVYAIPYATTIPVLYVNRDLVKAAGFNPDSFPDTWPEIFEISRKIHGSKADIIGINLEYDSSAAWMFQTFLMGYGGRMMAPDDSTIMFDSEAGKKALELIAQFGRSGSADMLSPQARQAFSAGTLGINVRTASGIPGVVKETAGNFELDIKPLPVLSEDGLIPGAGNGLMMLTEDPEKQKQVWEFFKFMLSGAGQRILVEKSGYMPVNQNVVKAGGALSDFFNTHPLQKASLQQLDRAVDWYAFPGDNSLKIFDAMIESQRQLIIGQTTPDKAMANMVDATTKLLRR
ncbi:extracellular solute-binding protein [Rhizobium calliandrae]|uniref:sn-glycerol-3-phosphate-binding periplasmic protein UgpB n=1 Tax=Rhizobium calliandrae TaxID=1312182 RepID=A0ABT7KQ13_9HYPH|nr:extracellular solute-binding protein [Rhizobium calliandrae]MDL2410715.1 extracellular solute-binding protein [Rhizobium calliandrae]